MNSFFSSAKTRLIAKAIMVGILGLLMMIPLAFISELVEDRRQEALKAVQEVGNSWSTAQTLTGPVIGLAHEEDVLAFPPTATGATETHWTHYLPQELTVDATLHPRKLKRGIFPILVYNAVVKIEGSFCLPIAALQTHKSFLQGEATISLGISDLRGIEDQVSLTLDGHQVALAAGLNPAVGTQGLTAKLPASLWEQAEAAATPSASASASASPKEGLLYLPFSLELPLKGSGSMWFAPMGQMNHIHVSADYPSPKFSGNYLPSERTVSNTGFDARWDIPSLTRNYGQQLTQADWYQMVVPSLFGVELLDTVSSYRQTQRAVKYALLVIVLTFVVIFFTDHKTGNRMNVFQYLLSGLALVLFYALLISLSEVIPFGWAYALAAALTTALLSVYLHHLLPYKNTALYMSGLLCCVYLFIYLLLQMESYALLTGSLGLFLILAGVMRLSTKETL